MESQPTAEEQTLFEHPIYVSLTHRPLDPTTALSYVKSPKAGAVVLFAGCTRDTFDSRPVLHLKYSTYAPLALRSMQNIARAVHAEHDLTAVYIVHRLGKVDVGEESILIAVSAPHRQAGWRAGEECLERIKEKVEIWKEEHFEGGGVWRANRDGKAGVPVRSEEDDPEKEGEA